MDQAHTDKWPTLNEDNKACWACIRELGLEKEADKLLNEDSLKEMAEAIERMTSEFTDAQIDEIAGLLWATVTDQGEGLPPVGSLISDGDELYSIWAYRGPVHTSSTGNWSTALVMEEFDGDWSDVVKAELALEES